MPAIQEAVEIKAPAEAVFDLVAKVKDFAFYTGFIKKIKLISGAMVDGASEWNHPRLGCDGNGMRAPQMLRLALDPRH